MTLNSFHELKTNLLYALLIGCATLSGAVKMQAQHGLEIKYNLLGLYARTYDANAEYLLSQKFGVELGLSYLPDTYFGLRTGEMAVHLGGKYYPLARKRQAAGLLLGLSPQFNHVIHLEGGRVQNIRTGYRAWGLGAELGYKWIIKKRIVAEPSLRLAQVVYNRQPPYPKGVSNVGGLYLRIGYRFSQKDKQKA